MGNLLGSCLSVFVLSLSDFFVAVPILLGIILKRFQILHRRVTSDIPGNLHAFDDCVISLFRTLPEPSNFNLVWTAVPLSDDKPLIIRGFKPKDARINSITIYNSEKLNDQPKSFDLNDVPTDETGKQFEIVLTRNKTKFLSQIAQKNQNLKSYQYVVELENWNRCMIAMRNYLIPPGVSVPSPEISEFHHPLNILRPTEHLITGPAGLKFSNIENNRKFIFKIILINSIATLVNLNLLGHSEASNVGMLLVSAFLAVMYRQLCFHQGKKSLQKMTNDIVISCQSDSNIQTSNINRFVYPSREASSSTSQPSLLHKYWLMPYSLLDLSENAEIRITGKIIPELQKYWSIVVYDMYGMPNPQYVYDTTAVRKECNENNKSEKNAYEYDVRLSRHPRQEDGVNIIDVSKHPIGYVLFRIVHPTCDEITLLSISSPNADIFDPNIQSDTNTDTRKDKRKIL